MSFKYSISLFKPLLLTAIYLSSAATLSAASSSSVEQRLSRVENLIGSQVLIEQSQRLEQIQQELSSLRELMETQENQLEMIKQRQRNLYQDMDRRLNDLEIKGGGAASRGSSTSPVAAPGSSSPVAAPATASTKPSVAAPVSGDKNGKSAYSLAFNTLKEGRYQQAILAFREFQKNYPESVYGANAQYWLGEAYSVSRDYKTALSEFQKVISQYPESNKVQDTMLKIGFTYYEMQDWASAKSSLDTVISKYPGSTVSRKAKERLQRMKREGH